MLKILCRWQSNAVERYIAGMVRTVFLQTAAVSDDTVVMTKVLQCKMDELNENIKKVAELADTITRHARAPGYSELWSRHPRQEGPLVEAVLVQSERPGQESRARLHLAPVPVGSSSTWCTFGCGYKYGVSKFSLHAVADLQKLRVRRCQSCFTMPYFFCPETSEPERGLNL